MLTIDTRQEIIETAIRLGLDTYADWMTRARFNQKLFNARLRALRLLEAGVSI